MEKVFNLAFLTGLSGLFFSRLLYVILFFKPVFLNPLAFLLFPYFPGLSLGGGLLGGSLTLIFLLRGKKYPDGRLFDFFILAFSVSLMVGEIILFLVSYILTRQFSFFLPAEVLITLCIFGLAFRAIKQQLLKEGSVGLIVIMFLSLSYIGLTYIQKPHEMMLLYKEIGTWAGIFLISFVFFLRQESFLSLFKLFGKK